MLVCQIAWEVASPEVRQKVSELIVDLDNRFNAGQPYNFTTIGCWMDDLRSLPRKDYAWGKWHYVDAPKTDDGSGFTLPEPPHVVWAIDENLKTLRDPAAGKVARATAVAQLMHWIGDIHQPLHATTWDDRGGNGYMITGPKFTDMLPGMTTNLHTYWDKAFRFDGKDGAIVETWVAPETAARPKNATEGTIHDQAKLLMEKFPAADLQELKAPLTAETWARESHVIGCTKAYPPGDHPRDTEVRKLTPEWVAASRPIAERRVVVAGHRMAAILAEALKSPQTPKSSGSEN
jgi:nuclease S1